MSTLANYFAYIGYDITMILVRNKEQTYEIDKRINKIQLTSSHDNKLYILCKRLYEIRKNVKNSHGDTVISFMTDINLFTILACFNLKKRIIISERAHPLLINVNQKKPIYIRILRKILYPFADGMVFQTKFAKECYPTKIQKKGYLIPNPIPPDLPNVHKGLRKKVIVAAGRLSEEKNFGMLISAFHWVSQIHKEYQLIIYGRGHMLEYLLLLRKNLNLEEKVYFPGYVGNLTEQIKDASMYV